jgi:exo-beta-1,3-glucanase (GH17 family)
LDHAVSDRGDRDYADLASLLRNLSSSIRSRTVSCSNVANVAKAVRAAPEALGVWRVDLARERLVEVLEELVM